MFMHVVSIGVIPTMVYVFRATPQLEVEGDFLNQLFKLIPTYGLSVSVYADAVGGNLADIREISNG